MVNDPELEKLDVMAARIRKAEGEIHPSENASAKASNVGYDFLGSILGGALLGWLVDRFFDTQPWGLIGMIFLGFGVGLWNVWKAMDKQGKS